MKKFTVSEDTEIVLDGKKFLLEAGDEIGMDVPELTHKIWDDLDTMPTTDDPYERLRIQRSTPKPGRSGFDYYIGLAFKSLVDSGKIDTEAMKEMEEKDLESIWSMVYNTAMRLSGKGSEDVSDQP